MWVFVSQAVAGMGSNRNLGFGLPVGNHVHLNEFDRLSLALHHAASRNQCASLAFERYPLPHASWFANICEAFAVRRMFLYDGTVLLNLPVVKHE